MRRIETTQEAQRIVNLMPNSIRLASEGIGRRIGSGEVRRGEDSIERSAYLLSHRIVELAEARVMLNKDRGAREDKYGRST